MEASDTRSKQGGMAIFAVLSLMVIFTVLGVTAISVAQRDNSSSGDVLAIKSKESAAYAGLVFAIGELQRNPANLVTLLESWRTKSVYGSATAPYPSLYLKFSSTGGAVQFSTTTPAAFQLPNGTSTVVVKVLGITLPSVTSEEPRIALQSTGTTAAGDAQSLLGVYRITNLRVTAGNIALPITHPFYISGGGDWNSDLQIANGNAFLGATTHLNSSVRNISITNGDLRVAGDFEWDNLNNFSVSGNVYINGDLNVHAIAGVTNLAGHVIVAGDIGYASSAVNPLVIGKSLYVLGTNGIPNLNGNYLEVGNLDPNSVLYIPKGLLSTTYANAWVKVKGSAYIHQLVDNAKVWAFDVSRRLELGSKNTVKQTFKGAGNWGQIVVRNVAPLSRVVEGATVVPAAIGGGRGGPNFNQINILGSPGAGNPVSTTGNPVGESWISELSDFTFGTALGMAPWQSISVNPGTSVWLPGAAPNVHTTVALSPKGTPADVSTTVGADGFDNGSAAPPSLSTLGVGLPPSSTNDVEPVIDFSTDPTALNNAWTATGSAKCTSGGLCGAGIQDAYDNDVSLGKPHFHNGFFVVKLPFGVPLSWTTDLGGIQTSMLHGKYLFYVDGDYGGSTTAGWPTTAPNTNPTNPDNVIFIYAKGPRGKIFAGFCPRFKLSDVTTPVVFTGYVRYDDDGVCPTGHTWTMNPATPLTVFGAFHLVGSQCSGFTINSGSTMLTTRFQFDQNVLNSIGTAFGTNIKVNGTFLGVAPGQFMLTENWVQFRPVGELR